MTKSTRALELAAQFTEASDAFADFLEGLAPGQWSTLVPGEERTVAALAHHVAWGFGFEMQAFAAIAAAEPFETVSAASLDNANAEHALEYAYCARGETIAFLRAETAATAAAVRGFADEALGRRGRYLEQLPEMTVERYLQRILVGHVLIHQRSIREALGLQ